LGEIVEITPPRKLDRRVTAAATPLLPMSRAELAARGWERCDVILVTGDAYVDHPSYGVALVSRLLESRGWRVGIIAQPDWRSLDDFRQLGEPRLFFGVTGGNVDSMIANLSSGKRRRKTDDYAPGDRAGLRPDRATIVYANRLREAYAAVPIVLGGLEASLRRLAHYDFWDDKVRRSVLLDARADILVYGMAERQIAEIATRLDRGEVLDGIRGTVVARATAGAPPDAVVLPSFERVAADKAAYGEAFRLSYANMDPGAAKALVQPHGDRVVVQYPPARTLGTTELDALHGLPFARRWHPRYDAQGGIRALETVRHSIISHRGCCGECSFCAITYHQGRIVQSRSEGSVLQEVRVVAAQPDFRGTITDIGGPTANLHAAHCKRWDRDRTCAHRRCLVPEKCPSLDLGYNDCIRLYRKAAEVPGVKHVFLGSGLRHDLLVGPAADAYLRQICAHQVSGLLKVAPEHCDDGVLRLMNKPGFAVYEAFVKRFKAAAKAVGKEIYIVNYFITSHPGASLRENLKLALYLAKRRIKPEQIQDFIPAPGTLATCMYYTGRDPLTGKPVHVARSEKERRQQRAMVQYEQPRNRELLVEALTELDSLHVLPKFEQASQPRPGAPRKPQRGRRR
jgi:uncharacterized radical SAM protein YgiQ